jgi:hypothetical protein
MPPTSDGVMIPPTSVDSYYEATTVSARVNIPSDTQAPVDVLERLKHLWPNAWAATGPPAALPDAVEVLPYTNGTCMSTQWHWHEPVVLSPPRRAANVADTPPMQLYWHLGINIPMTS